MADWKVTGELPNIHMCCLKVGTTTVTCYYNIYIICTSKSKKREPELSPPHKKKLSRLAQEALPMTLQWDANMGAHRELCPPVVDKIRVEGGQG